MSKIIVTGTDAAPVYTKTATTAINDMTLAATTPLSILDSDSNEYYSKDAVGKAVVTAAVAGVVVGDKFGDKIPVLGGRR